jgi:hypothetical protein
MLAEVSTVKTGKQRKLNRRVRRQVCHTYDYEMAGLSPTESRVAAMQDRSTTNHMMQSAIEWNKDGQRWLTDATKEQLDSMVRDDNQLTAKELVIMVAHKTLSQAIVSPDMDPDSQKSYDRMCRVIVAAEAQNQRDDLAAMGLDETGKPVSQIDVRATIAKYRERIAASEGGEYDPMRMIPAVKVDEQ